MIELPEDKYKQLMHDADDNRSIRSVLRWCALIFFFVAFMFSYGCHAIDMRKQVEEAHTQVEVREIQSQGMTHEEYIEWLEAGK